ncbi:MAG TPA: hypothetical protein DCQ13_03870 [Firmicutes bacterium]|jgi:hypothetical protein|nr:hypothetical protein [Bacillota bacterium]
MSFLRRQLAYLSGPLQTSLSSSHRFSAIGGRASSIQPTEAAIPIKQSQASHTLESPTLIELVESDACHH